MNYAIKQFGLFRQKKLWTVFGLFAVLAIGLSVWQRSVTAAPMLAPVACTYTALPLAFNLQNADAVAQLNVIVTTQAGCTHKMTSNVDWLTVLSGTKTGTDAHQFKVAANPDAAARTGWLTVGGWAVKVTQPGNPCSYAVSPMQVSVVGHQASNATITVATTLFCNWTTTSNANWISVTDGINETGPGVAKLSIQANASETPRLGTVTVAGKTVTISQAAWTCSYALDAASANIAAGGGNGNVQVITPNHCPWTAQSNVSWMTITAGASGKGSGTVSYNVKPSDSASQRTGTLTIAGKSFTVTQAGNPCSLEVSPTSVPIPNPLGHDFSITVKKGAEGCSTSPTENADWIIVQGFNNYPDKVVWRFFTTENKNAATRTATILMAGKTVTVTQPGQSCTFAVSPTAFNLPDSSSANLLKVNVTTQAGCIWTTQTNGGNTGLTIDSGFNQTGSGAAYFSVAANNNSWMRTFEFWVAGQKVTVTQPGNCPAIALNPASLPAATMGLPFTQTLTANGGSAPYTFSLNADTLPAGVQLNGNSLSGTPTMSGAFNFTVKATDANGCVGTKAYTLTINQQACPTLNLTPASFVGGAVGTAYAQTLTASGGSAPYTFSLSAGTLPPGLQLNGNALSGTPTTNGAYSFTFKVTDANGCAGAKQYTINIGCATITLNPATLPAATVGTMYSQTLSATGGAAPYTYSLMPGATLPPGLTLANDVLSGTPTSPTVGHNFTLKVTDANGCIGSRGYLLPVAPASVVTVSAASYKEGAAPESIVAAFGVKLADTTQVGSTLPLPTTLANVSVGVTDSLGTNRLAPLFFVSAGQINYLVPPGTALGTATIRVFNGNEMVAAGTLEIANVAPGLFTANANGQGVAAAVALRIKGDGSLSYEQVAELKDNQFTCKPIDLGPEGEQVFLVLFGTGLRFHSGLPNVSATLGGNANGEVGFADAAPGFTGLDQVNVKIPRALIGRGELDLGLIVAGKAANTVRLNIQ